MLYQKFSIINIQLLLLLLIFNINLNKVKADTVETTIKFNVVNVDSKEICVNINDNSIKLTNNDFPLWSVSQTFNNFTRNEQIKYNYSYCDLTMKEDFQRTIDILVGEENETINDVFNRPPTKDVGNLRGLWEENYYPSQNEIFDINYVGTYYLKSKDKILLKQMNEIPHYNIKVPVNGKFIGKKSIKSINEDGWQLSIAGNYSRMFTKQSFRLAYRGDEDEDDLDIAEKRLKFKAFPNDITMLREPLSIEILQKIGVPTCRGSFSRLYIDNDYYGLYYVEDDIRRPYLKNLFHRTAKKKAKVGSLFQAIPDNGKYLASLTYLGDNIENYPMWNSTWKCKVNGTDFDTEEDGFLKMVDLMKSINQTDFHGIKDKNALFEEIYKNFELDILIRILATDYLFGRFHGYWRNPSNFMVYYHPALSRFVIFPVDYTSSFGYKYNENDFNANTNITEWRDLNNLKDPLIDLIFNIPTLKKLLYSTIKLLVNTIFTSKALFPFIDSLTEIIKFDLSQDKTICPGHSEHSIVTETIIETKTEENVNEKINGSDSNSTISTTIIKNSNTTVTLINPPCSISNSLLAINNSISSVGFGIKEWIDERSKYVDILLINETICSQGSLVTRPPDPSNLYSDSMFDYFRTIFTSGRYGLLAFLLIFIFIIIVIVYILYHKYKKPTEMVGDEHDIRKYNGSFKDRLKFSFESSWNSIKHFFQNINKKIKKLFSSVKNSHNID